MLCQRKLTHPRVSASEQTRSHSCVCASERASESESEKNRQEREREKEGIEKNRCLSARIGSV
jgi:hypothetical protein